MIRPCAFDCRSKMVALEVSGGSREFNAIVCLHSDLPWEMGHYPIEHMLCHCLGMKLGYFIGKPEKKHDFTSLTVY